MSEPLSIQWVDSNNLRIGRRSEGEENCIRILHNETKTLSSFSLVRNYNNADNASFIVNAKDDKEVEVFIKTDNKNAIEICGYSDTSSKITLHRNGNARIELGTDDTFEDEELYYIRISNNNTGYTGIDNHGLLLASKFADSSSTEPDEENETRIQAFDSDFLSYANNNQEKIEYLKRTIPSSYAVSSAIKAIQPFSVYPFEFIVTDVDNEGNAEFKIRYYYQDGSNKYRDFTFNYADKQGSASAEFDAAPVTLTGIDKYVARVNSLIAGGSGSAIIADETFDSQRMLAWNYSASVPVDIEFNNCTFTNDSMVSLFAAVAGQSSPSNLTVKFTNCNCNAIIDMHSMFANLIDTTRLQITGLEMSDSLKDIRRLFVYLGARTDGCDLVIDECNFGDAKGEYTVSGTTIDGVIDIYSWSKIRYINLEAIGLTNQTSNIGDGEGTVSHTIGRFEPNCDESAILPYYIPISSFTVRGKIPRDNNAEPARDDGFLNYSYNFIARDYEVQGRNELYFEGVGMNDAPATIHNQLYTIRFYTVNELILGNYEDTGPYDKDTEFNFLSFNYPNNVSGVTVSPKLERFGVYFTSEEEAAAAGITKMILMNGSTKVDEFNDIEYNGPEATDDSHAVMYNGQNFIEYFNEQNYAFTLNNGDVYFIFTNPTATVPSFEWNGILSTK